MFNFLKKQCDIEYSIIRDGDFYSVGYLKVSTTKLFGFRLWSKVKILGTTYNSSYELNRPTFENLSAEWWGGKSKLYSFMEKYPTTEKYLKYVEDLKNEYNNLEIKYIQDLMYIKNKYNLK
jgi:hypothetical protein